MPAATKRATPFQRLAKRLKAEHGIDIGTNPLMESHRPGQMDRMAGALSWDTFTGEGATEGVVQVGSQWSITELLKHKKWDVYEGEQTTPSGIRGRMVTNTVRGFYLIDPIIERNEQAQPSR